MVASPLRDYIDECVRQGCVLSDVKQTLLSTGWPAAEVEEALAGMESAAIQAPALPPVPAEPADVGPAGKASKKGPWKRVAIVSLGTVGALALLVGVPTALAEQGYLPAFSRVYRLQNVGVAWNGLPGTPSLALAESIKAVAAVKAIGLSSKNTAEISQGPQTASAEDLNDLIGKGLAFFGSDAAARSLAAVPTDMTATVEPAVSVSQPSQDYSQYLPLKVSLDVDGRSDASDNSDVTVAASATANGVNLLQKFNAYLPETATLEAITHTAGKRAFFKANLLPYLSVADQDRWFSSDFSGLKEDNPLSVQGAVDSITPENLRDLQQIVDGLFVDKGIERVDGRAEAHFAAAVTQASLESIKKAHPENALLKGGDDSSISTKGSLAIDIWIGESDHLPYRIKVVNSGPLSAGTSAASLDIKVAGDISATYANLMPVAIPSGSQVLGSDIFGYAEKACGGTSKAPAGSSFMCAFMNTGSGSVTGAGLDSL